MTPEQKALGVILTTPAIRDFLLLTDPKALAQVAEALADVDRTDTGDAARKVAEQANAVLGLTRARPRWGAARLQTEAERIALALVPKAPGPVLQGTAPAHSELRAFVAGAAWWQFKANGATAFPSERDEMEAEAARRYPLDAAPAAPWKPEAPRLGVDGMTTERRADGLQRAITALHAELNHAVKSTDMTDYGRGVLRERLRSYEATGDHNHGNGPIPPGGACPGGDCLVAQARVLLGSEEQPLAVSVAEGNCDVPGCTMPAGHNGRCYPVEG